MANREPLQRWLLSEQLGDDDAAEAAFAQLFSALPKTSPDPTFVDRTMVAIAHARAERRRAVAFAWAASVIVATMGATVAYAAAPSVGEWTIKAIAFATGHSVPWLISYTAVALDWWWTVGRIGGSVAAAVATPARAIALVGVELIGILAFIALQNLVRVERIGDAQL